MVAPFEEECVCHTALADKDNFIFMYETVFKELGISLPFDFFFAEVLKTLGIAPSQLHPNSWAILRAFETVCQALSIKPTAPLLFSFYTTQISRGTTWVSLAAMHRMNLFLLRILQGFEDPIREDTSSEGCPHHYGRGTHPWYWRTPNRGLSLGDLNVEDQVSWGILNQLPRGMNCKVVMAASFATDPNSYLIVIIKKSGYDLSAMIHRGRTVVGNKSVGLTVDSTPPSTVSTMLVVQQKLAFKPVPTPPPLPSSKRKVTSFPREGEVKKAKPMEAILAVEPSLVAASFEIVAVDRSTSSIKEDLNTAAGPSEIGSLWGLWLDPPSLRLGVKLGARDRELLLSTGTENSLKIVANSCICTTVIVNALRLALLQTEKLAREGLWNWQKMAKLLNNNSKLKRANQ
ncbi:hypothetical protein CR513_34102, partial [Mucuna pruriens]